MKHPFDSIELTSYVTGDISAEKRAKIEEHLGGCETCAVYVKQLQEEQKMFNSEMPYNGSVDETDTGILHFPKMKIISSIAALLIFAVSIQFTLRENVSIEQQTIALKGAEQISFFVENDTGGVEERDSDIYYPGERIQVCYSTVATAYLTLFSMDSNGTLSRFFPTSGTTSTKVEPGISLPLPHSIRLDSYIGEEKFIMVFSAEPLSIQDVEEKISFAFQENQLDSLSFGNESRVVIHTIEKREKSE